MEPVTINKKLQLLVLFTLNVNFIVASSNEKSWTGKWFPENKTSTQASILAVSDTAQTTDKPWAGKWFPRESPKHESDHASFENDRIMGIPNSDCDDGEVNLAVDFDPHSSDHSVQYTCLELTYKPSYDIEPVLTVYDVPKYYTPVHKCMNESITYDQRIPTLSYHRPLWAQFGEYKYLPPQRWLHNIEHGAIVFLYHPCANQNIVDKLRTIVKNCLYRHIITPYKLLSPERPFALAAWGATIEFSVLDSTTVIDFIKQHAKKAPEKVSRDGQYKQLLTEHAKIITSEDDFILCPNAKASMM